MSLRNGQKRTERLDVRLTPADKAILIWAAKKKRRTLTSLLEEWIEKLGCEGDDGE